MNTAQDEYTGSGVNNCWGFQADPIDGNDFIHVTAFMYLPSDSADETTPGYRWITDETINIRLTVAGDDNLKSAVTLAESILGLSKLSAIAAILVATIVF